MRVSYSALETFKQCPQKYKFQEIDKIRVPKSKEALFGTAIHGALEFMFSRDPLFPTLEEVLAHFREHFEEKSTLPDADRARYVEIGQKMIRNFYEKNPPWNFDIVDLESHFEALLVDKVYEKTHVLVGKIDRIDKLSDGSYEIIDYKTNRKLPSQDDIDKNTQLAVYQLGLKKRWPHLDASKIKLSMYFLRAQEKFSTMRTDEKLTEAEERLLSSIHAIEKRIEEGSFPPTPSALCDWCGYKPVCPAWRHLYEQEEKPKINDAVREYLEVKKEIDERKKRAAMLSGVIQEYMQKESLDRVFGDQGSIMRSLQERSDWNADDVQAILSPLPEWESILSVDTKKLGKILPSLPYEIQEKLKNEARIVKKFMALKISKKKEKK